MKGGLHVIFGADQNVIPGLHVAALSVLLNYTNKERTLHYHVFTDTLTAEDLSVLRKTLDGTRHPYVLETHRADASMLREYPALRDSRAAVFRLLAPQVIIAERFIYLDVDIVCYLSIHELWEVDLQGCPAAFVSEATIQSSADSALASLLGKGVDGPYLNSGVMLVDRNAWQSQQVTERCVEYLSHGPAMFRDQSALNYVLRGSWHQLETRFNYIANWRSNWPSMITVDSLKGKILHFVDYPKPWDLFGEWIHPNYHLWRSVLNLTEMRHYHSLHRTVPQLPHAVASWRSYKKALKDRLLFEGYRRGLLKRVKGLP